MSDVKNTGLDQFLTFQLGEEIFAVDIGSVREVLELSEITKMPSMPNFMRGVLNLRGHAVPVVDMRKKFNMEHKEDTVETCVIITEVKTEAGELVLGALVDSVNEVFEMESSMVEDAPNIGDTHNAKHIKGMGRQNDRFVIILDISSIFSQTELDQVQTEIGEKDQAA